MKSIIVWTIFSWSILCLTMALITRLRELFSEKSFFSFLLNEMDQLHKKLYEIIFRLKIEIPEILKLTSIVSSYNFRSILSLLPFFKKLPISNENRFVKAFLYDYNNRISKENHMINSNISYK
jgi:hypothetical protein